MGLLGVVDVAEEEDLARKLLPHLAGQVGGTEAAVEGTDVAMVRSETTCRECPPPAAQPLTSAITTLGMNRMSRCASRMCSRASFTLSTVFAVSPSAYWYPARPRMRWSPPEQNAQPPSFGLGPLPVRSTQPMSALVRACSRAAISSSTVWGRKALRTSGRLKAILTAATSRARW